MKSRMHPDFMKRYKKLPPEIRELARKSYKFWKKNPYHPSLHFKNVGGEEPVYSVRVGLSWRAMGLLEGDEITWFWIGPHGEYDLILR